MRKLLFVIASLLVISTATFAQNPEKPTSSQIYESIKKLNFLGSALYIAAHPDDENQRLISYFSNELKARTAYLALTRGDGGQNLVGPEIRELLGVIRTQELLAARRTDGGQQLFTRANDFGYSKHPDETLAIWNKSEVLSDVVLAIRRFKPDIIINRFDYKNPGSTHGHHTSSAMLSMEAFDLVGDATSYPEHFKNGLETWQPTRLFFNTSWWFYGSRKAFAEADKTNLVEIETGSYYPSFGMSNGEIASLARSMHKSQGFGSTGTRGSQTEYLEYLKGDFPKDKSNLFDGINTTWSRVKGGEAIGAILYEVEKNFDFKNPSASVSELMKAYELIQNLTDSHWKNIKTEEIKNIIISCSGIYLEAVSNVQSVSPIGALKVRIEAVNRSNVSVKLNSINSTVISFPQTFAATPLLQNSKYTTESVDNSFTVTRYTSPYWLLKKGTLGMYNVSNPDLIGMPEETNLFPVTFNLSIEGKNIAITKNIIYKFNDPVKGEVYQPFEVLPIITTGISEKVIIFSSQESKEIPVTIRAGKDSISGSITLEKPDGWTISPISQTFSIDKKGEEKTFVFTVTPPTSQAQGVLKPLVQVGSQYFDKELIIIDYDHIPYQSILMSSEVKIVRLDIQKKGQNIGYINGAGDAIPESLKQIGYTITTITPEDITAENLSKYDAVVFGIRAYNTEPILEFKQSEINKYVENGGTVLVQYNTSHRLVTKDFSPYSITLSRERVTDEFSEVRIINPKHPVILGPNKITKNDFKDWVQERGLYFPGEWSEEFETILEMNDIGAKPSRGSLIIARHGNGHFIYTGLSFFRELPAGVPGAYRLFANLLSLGK